MKKTLLLLFLLSSFLGFSQTVPAGTYVINSASAAPLNSLANAIAYINPKGIAGNVTLLLDNDQILTSQIVIDQFAGSSTYTLTIKPNTGKTILISGGQANTSTSLLKLNGADNIIIDGSNTVNGSSRDLTFKNTVTNDNNTESIIWVGSSSNSNGAEKNIFKNVNFSGNSTSSNGPVLNGILFSSSSGIDNQEDISNSDNIIQNNTFSKIRYAVNVKGNSTTYSKNLTLTDNIFGGSGNEIVINAIRIKNGQNYIISKNTISEMTRSDNGYRLVGIYLEGNSNVGTVSKNIIKGISTTAKGRATGILVDLLTTNNAGLTISNNFITNIKTSNDNVWDVDNSSSGIFINAGKGINIYYNTVVLNGSQIGLSSALVLNSGSILNIRNNIFSNTNSAGYKYALYSNLSKSDYSDINYNNYNATGAYLALVGSQLTTLAQLQAGTGKDLNSKNATPVFVTSNDYRLDVSNNIALQGTSIAGITTDIDGDTRVKPYMGADEPNSCTSPVITTQPSDLIACEGQNGSFSVATSTSGVTYQWQYSYDGTTGWTNTDGTQDVSDHKTATLKLTNLPLSYSGYFVRCLVSSSATCFSYSGTAKLTVNPKVVASVSITSSDTPTYICDGSAVTFTATPTNGGASPTYQWLIGTTEVQNSKSATYKTSALKDGDVVKVIMTSNATSACLTASPATSNAITITVIKTDRGVTRGGNHICYGSPSPTLGVYNTEGPDKDKIYTESSKIIRWEYSDDNNKTWVTIDNTAGLTTYTPPGILAASRNFRAVAKSPNCPQGFASIETRIDVEFAPTISSQSTATQTQCIGGTFTPLTVTATGYGTLKYQWYSNTTASTTGATSLPNTNGARTNSYTPQSTTAGTLYYYCIVTGTCGPTTSAFSEAIITKDAPKAPKVGTITQPSCTTSTGSVVLEDVPNSGRLVESRGTTYNFTTAGTTFEITGLAPGTYKFAIDNSCSIVYSADIVIQPANTWDGTKWSSGTPKADNIIEFKANYSLDTDLTGCSCTVSNNAVVTIKSGRTLKITDAINVVSGSLIFENNSSLIQVNNVVNTGNITYKRIAPKIRQADFVYWSTPVNPQKLIDVSPKTAADKYYYNNAPGWIEIDRNSTMAIGKGYIVRGPEDYSNTAKADYEASFVGVPNNGTYTTPSLTVARYHLLGNPYPSALSVDDLTAGNSVLNGTVYLWTHNTGVDTSGSYGYNPADYASYNGTGSVATTGNAANTSEKPTGFIGAGQAFFVSTRATGPVVFNNSMRRGGTNNSQFFKSSETSKEAGLEKNRVWLNMTNANGLFKQLLVGYIEGATNGYENRFDGITMDANSYLDFYSIMNSNKFVIQGRGLPFTDTDLVPLGYRTTVAGDFTIAIDEVDGKMSDQKIYIEDKTTGVVHDLTQSNYTFKTEAGTFTDRLVLRYTGKTLGTGDFENIENAILVSVKNKVINILSSQENIKEITIYDISGKLLYNKKKVGSTELQIQNLQSSNQVLLVKVNLENDFVTTKKIIFN